MAARTVEIVERDIKRVKRAEGRLRRDWNVVHRNLAKFGGIEGLPKKGEPASEAPPKLSVYVRHQRELAKALRICSDELKALEAEKTALSLQVDETRSEYAL